MSDQIEQMTDEEFEAEQSVLDEHFEVEASEAPIVTEEPTEEVEEDVVEEETEDIEETDPEPQVEEEDEADVDSVEDELEPEEDEEESQVEAENVETNVDEDATSKQFLQPLKVSGKDVQVKSIDDMRSLAQMGVDYSRKMREIKPLRAVGETLAKAGLINDGVVDEEALARLLDISSGNKDALASLMKEQEIDPLDMEIEDVNYTPQTTMVSEGAIALQDVEKELVSRGSVDSVVNAIGRLDERSKQFFNETPANLLKLEDDITSGVYDKIMGTVEYERSLGRLGNMSDMEAYVQFASAESQPQTAPVVEKTVTKASTSKRKAAGISKRAPAKKQKTPDFVGMSDEEFEALTPNTSLY